MQNRSKIIGKVLIYSLLMFIVFITVIPIAYTVSASFKTNTEIMSGGAHLIPKKTTFENYIIAWTMGSSGGSRVGRKTVTFADYTVNSLKMSAIAVLGSVIFTSMLAYTIQRGRFPGRKLLFGMYLGTMFIAAGAVTLFPIVKLAAIMKINNLYGAALVQMFTASAANLFLTIGYMKTISRELDDAAKIDGCSFFRTYYNIILPLSKPILATIALISFRRSWNDYLLPMVFTIGKPWSYPLVVGVVALKNFGGEGAAQYNLLMAGTMFSIIPILVIYLVMNKYFVSGLTQGAIKG
jgi:ABC-type glycerol-3-phosphate transport system permease component